MKKLDKNKSKMNLVSYRLHQLLVKGVYKQYYILKIYIRD